MFSWKEKKKKVLEINSEIVKDKYFDLKKSNRYLRKFSASLIIINLILVTGIITISKKNKIQTFIVEKNQNNYSVLGDIENVAGQKNVKENEIISRLYDFIYLTKTLTSDLELYKKSIDKATFYMTENSKNKFEFYLKENGYEEFVKKGFKIETVFSTGIKLEENTYQLRYVFRIINKEGKIEKEIRKMSMFNISFSKYLENKNEVIYNPLGLKIIDFVESTEIEGGN